jgi:hypothetical protein
MFFTFTYCSIGGYGSWRFSKIVKFSTISALTRGRQTGNLKVLIVLRNAQFPKVFPEDDIVKEVANHPRAPKRRERGADFFRLAL